MNDFFKKHKIEFGQGTPTVFDPNKLVNQDGTTPMYRDVDGKLWAMSGHTHAGRVAVFCGKSLDDIHEVYPIKTNLKRVGEEKVPHTMRTGLVILRNLTPIFVTWDLCTPMTKAETGISTVGL